MSRRVRWFCVMVRCQSVMLARRVSLEQLFAPKGTRKGSSRHVHRIFLRLSLRDWPAVFLMQNVIQATVREEWPHLAHLSSKELFVVLQQRLQETAASGYDTRCIPPESLVTDFLSREVSYVSALVNELQSAGRDIPTRHPRFALNEERLHSCMMESEGFRRYILEKPEKGVSLISRRGNEEERTFE